jgi:hypothetical protein
MSTITGPQGTKTGYTITLNSLADNTYVASNAVDTHTTAPLDILVEVTITPGTVAAPKQAKVFLQASLDASVYSTGPTTGSTATDEPNLYALGTVPLGTSAAQQTRQFSVMACLGFIPYAHKLVVRNESGAAFAGSGCSASYALGTGSSA